MVRHREFTAAGVLLLIRDRIADDWAKLCEEFGLDPNKGATAEYLLREMLETLHSAGLIDFAEEDSRFGRKAIKGRITISAQWEKIQVALDFSLAQMARVEPDKTMLIKPFFGLPTAPAKKSDVFVLMPFIDSIRPVYADHIAKVAKSLGLEAARADDFFTTASIMSDVWNAICDARIIVADCSNRNPNVFYEIGIAHTIGKRIVLITQNKDDIPVDIRHLRFIEYEFTPRGMRDFEERLATTIQRELGD